MSIFYDPDPGFPYHKGNPVRGNPGFPYHKGNPVRGNDGRWYWFDETGALSYGFRTKRAAARELRAYVRWLDHGPTCWQRLWWPMRAKLKEFWHDTRGSR